MPRNAKIFLLLAIAVFVAGCTSIPLFPGLDVISVNKETSVEGERNVLVIKDKLTIPKSPVLTDQSVQFSFILENKDANKKADSILVDLFDAPLMKSKSKDGPLCNQPSGRGCLPEGAAGNILPGEQRQVIFNLFSPSQAQIGGLKTDLKLNFLVRYNFEGSTSFTVPVVNMEEIAARQRAGDKIKVDVIKSIGSGPIQVDPELFGSPFILSSQSGTFFFVIKNKGSGNLPLSKVPPQGLCIYFPKEFFGTETKLVNPDGGECIGPECQAPTGSAIAKYVDEILGKPSYAQQECSLPNVCYKYECPSGYEQTTGTCDIIDSVCCKLSQPAQQSCDCVFNPNDGYSTCSIGCGSKEGLTCKTVSECQEESPQQPAPTATQCSSPNQCFKYGCPSGYQQADASCDIIDSVCCKPESQPPSLGPLFTCVSVESAGDVECNKGAGFTNKILCYNSREIELFRDESRVSMRFSIHKIKELDKDEPFKSMTILTKIKYPYELRDSFEITVIPAKE